MTHTQHVNRLIRRNLPHFWLCFAASFAVSAAVRMLSLLPALLMKRIIDVYIPASDGAAILRNIVLLVTVALVSSALTAWYRKTTIVTGRRMGHLLFARCFEKILYQPMRFYDENNSAEIASYCRTEAMEYVLLWIADLPQLLSNLCVGLTVFASLVQMNAAVGAIQLLYVPLLLIPSRLLANKTQGYGARITANRARTSQILSDTFRGIRFVKTMLIEPFQLKKLNQVNDDTLSVWSRMVALENAQGIWMTTLVDSLFTGVTFGLGALYVLRGQLSTGSLVIILGFLPQLFDIIKSVSKTNFSYKKMLGSYGKLFEMISMEDERDAPCENRPFVFQRAVRYDHVAFRYSEARGNVFSDLSFEIRRGEWVGVVGESGAGKSTMVDLLQKFYTPGSGHIFIDDTDVGAIDPCALRRNVISVAQDTFLFPGTLRENLLLANPHAGDEALTDVLARVQLADLLQKLPHGLDEEIGENGVQLSGGQRQRLALAQALLHGCQILILDEVTSNLDEKTEQEIACMLKALQEKERLTILCISHRPHILTYADRVMTLKGGRAQWQTPSA